MAEAKKTTKKKKTSFEGLSVKDARLELQKVVLAVKSGEENDTSKIKKLKKYIARLKTSENKQLWQLRKQKLKQN